ncbi:MAG: hypothetical protein ABI566_01635 [Pseudolysinimonas sp.]
MAAMNVSALPDKAAFAAANGLAYSASGGQPQFVGSMFDYLQNSQVTDVFQLPGVFEVGIVTGTVGGGQVWPGTGGTVSTTFTTTDVATLGYMAIQLDAALPQYVLDARSNDVGTLSSIIMPIAGGQTISLEGDFDRYFTLYGPKGYETDARYVFTPDLMGLLIDETGDFDVEIVEDKLFVYARGVFDLSSAALWQRLDRIRRVVGAKALRQTGRYVDAKPLTEGSRRLRMGFFGSRSKVGLIFILALGTSVVLGLVGLVVALVVFP